MNRIDLAADGGQCHSCVNTGNESPYFINGSNCCHSVAVALL
jgi:hypothetical protein